ncbi:hypothetical protein HYW58_02745 [Candidatus Kaiserbacteria bacterium]|nr:hypothetical protein [Candidatus Kaiserbacteria bacterium]
MFENLLRDKNVQKALGVLVVVVALALIGWYIVNDLRGKTDGENLVQEGGIGADIREGEGVIQQIPVDIVITPRSNILTPKLDRALVFHTNLDSAAQDIIRNNIAQLTGSLKEQPDSFGTWLDLAIQYKIIGDYEGAAEIWEYLNRAAEGNTISRVNLGNLYHYELKEYEKSEANFKDALRINAQLPEAYMGLFELYRYSFKTNTTEAEDILREGITALPQNIDLVMTLAGYYKEKERVNDAKETYQKARTLAETTGNTALVGMIDDELSAL